MHRKTFVTFLMLISSGLWAREGAINTGEDFTRPLDRFDIRYTYQQTTGDTDKSVMTFRLDAPFELQDGWKFSTRFDMPILYTDKVSADNPNGDYEMGAGDMLSQFHFVSPHTENWSYGLGLRLIWPTASQDQMGTGKYQAAPGFGINYYPDSWSKGSFLGIRLAEYFDYAGDNDRADIQQTSIRAGFSYLLPDHWFISSIPDMRMNRKQGNDWFVPFNLKVGKVFDRKMVTSIELNTPIINDYDRYDWQIEFQFGMFF